jgi:hypothetical protein
MDLTDHVGRGMVAPEAIKLAATLALLCQKLADGKKKTIHAYLDYRISVASFYSERCGRELLATVTKMVQRDLDGRPNLLIRRRRLHRGEKRKSRVASGISRFPGACRLELYARAFVLACFIDDRARSAMNSANGSILMSMLARSSAAR